MAKVICTHPSATALMNVSGEPVKFVAHELGLISEEISDEMAKLFLECEGFVRPRKSAKVTDPAAVSTPKDDGDPGPVSPAAAPDPADPVKSTGVKAPDF